MARRIPGGATLVRIATGHIPPVTDPAGFAALCGSAATGGL
jgi:hypothetical protein